MDALDREGTFKFEIVEHGVGKTKNDFPQFVTRLKAVEYYDDSGALREDGTPGWVDWSEYEQYITAYLVLFNNEKPLFNYENLCDALGWDGSSFADLSGEEHVGKVILGGVEWNEYNGNTRLQVQWVNHKDSDPVRSLRTIDKSDLSDLDAKFSGMMASGKKSAAKAPAKAPEKPKKSKPEKKPAANSAPSAPAPSAPPAASKSDAPEMTKEQAWTKLWENRGNADDQEITNVWLEACEAIGKDESEFTNEDWGSVFKTALDKLQQTSVV